MNALCRSLFALLLISVLSCDSEENKPSIHIFSDTFDFNDSLNGWAHGFSDYPATQDSVRFELKYAYTQEPGGTSAIMLSGTNYNDDLFMFIKKKLEGLEPSKSYTITYDVEFASDAKSGISVDPNSSPAEGVFLKVGASAIEPKSVIDKGNFVMNIDKGNHQDSGTDMVTIGNVGVPADTDGYAIVSRNNSSSYVDSPLVCRTNTKGEIWLIVGTDSGYLGTTTLFYTKINVVLSASN